MVVLNNDQVVAEFTVSEKEMMQAATQLKNAIIILEKH